MSAVEIPALPSVAPTPFERVSRPTRLVIVLLAIVVAALVIAFARDAFFHWFQVHTGTVNETGPYYGFWSGFGSDLGEGTLVVGAVALWRHHNCHIQRCPRLGRQVAGTPYVACPRHHPAHEGTSRSISREVLHRAFHEARKVDSPKS